MGIPTTAAASALKTNPIKLRAVETTTSDRRLRIRAKVQSIEVLSTQRIAELLETTILPWEV